METKNNMMDRNSLRSLFVTHDPKGTPEHMACLMVQKHMAPSFDEAFLQYLNNELDIFQLSDTFPDSRVRRYDFNASLLDDNQLMVFASNPKQLQQFIAWHRLQPQYDYRLREVYGYCNGKTVCDRDFGALKRFMDPNNRTPKIQKQIWENEYRFSHLDYNSICTSKIHIIKTDKGILLLPNTGRGCVRLKAFLQYVDDLYFDPKGQEYGHVQVNALYSDSDHKKEKELSEQSSAMFSLMDDTFFPRKERWLKTRLKGNMWQGEDHPIVLNRDAFWKFTLSHNLDVSPGNHNIQGLLYIAEHGIEDSLFQYGVIKHFDHREPFRALELAARQASLDDRLLGEIRARQQHLAWFLLQKNYGITIPGLKFTSPVPEEFKPRTVKPTQAKTLKPKLR